MELSDISVSEHKHEEKAVVIKPKSAENEVKDHSYVNTTLVVGTDMNVQGKRETHIYEHLQTKKHNTSNCRCMTIFKQYKDSIMLSLNGVLLIAVTVLAIFIGLPEKTGINGGWALWGSWSQCSATCDTGATYRERTCSNPVPARGGMFCAGSPTEVRLCNQGFCPAVDAGWSDWSTWGICSATCGTGLQRRNRTCSDPAPEPRGRPCTGDFSEYQQCSIKICDGTGIGFSVYFPQNILASPVKFIGMYYNYNNSYNHSSGEFVCKQQGLYYFQVMLFRTAATYQSNPKSFCFIHKNNDYSTIAYVYSSEGHPIITGSVLHYLSPGDRVYIGTCRNIQTLYEYSTFLGFLITA